MDSICPNFYNCGHPQCQLVWQELCDYDDQQFQRFCLSIEYSKKNLIKELKHNSLLSGHMWMQELWVGNDNRFREQMRMSKETMVNLIQYLQANCGLTPYGRLSLSESVGMFMKFMGFGCSYTDVEERFQHSGETVFRHFQHVLRSMCHLGDQMVQPAADQFDDVPAHICSDSCYYPYFDGCVGALDGTHVVLRIPPREDNNRFVNRKGRFSTNVLAICDFNMCFIYADVGKEGSRNDASFLRQAMLSTRRPFPFPPLGKYFLGDSGYGLQSGILTPYKNSRYHIPEFRQVGVIRNREENFNYHHSSLRSVIERSFGVLKSRFRILQQMLRMKKTVQIQTVWACLGLHNFIRRYASTDFEEYARQILRDEYVYEVDSDEEAGPSDNEGALMDRGAMIALRDSIRDDLPFSGRIF